MCLELKHTTAKYRYMCLTKKKNQILNEILAPETDLWETDVGSVPPWGPSTVQKKAAMTLTRPRATNYHTV